MTKTQIPPLHLACGKDDLRPSLQQVYFKDGYAYASDGHILVKTSLEYFGFHNVKKLDGKAIHCKQFEQIVKSKVIVIAGDDCIAVKSDNGTATFNYASEDIKAPIFENVIPTKETESISNIGINAKVLQTALKCFITDRYDFKFSFYGNLSPILITEDSGDYDDQLILIMPIILKD